MPFLNYYLFPSLVSLFLFPIILTIINESMMVDCAPRLLYGHDQRRVIGGYLKSSLDEKNVSSWTPENLSTYINGDQASENKIRVEFDYEISRIFCTINVGTEKFLKIWRFFQPDNHIKNNEPFSIAVVDFFSRYIGLEPIQWLSDSFDERVVKYMGLGLRDYHISGGSSHSERKNMLYRIITLAGRTDIFSQRKSICQRVLMLATVELGEAIQMYPSLITCSTLNELEKFFSHSNSDQRYEIVKQYVPKFNTFQKDALVKQLNKLQNYHVDWHKDQDGVKNQLLQFDFRDGQKRELKLELLLDHSTKEKWIEFLNWPLSPNLNELPRISRWFSTLSEPRFALELLNLFEKNSIISLYRQRFLTEKSEIRKTTEQINLKLCHEFTLYQRHLISVALGEILKKKTELDATGWSNDDKNRFSCFLKVDSTFGVGSHVDQIETRTTTSTHKYAADWESTYQLDGIFEKLFYNGSEVSTREEAVVVVKSIRARSQTFKSLTQLPKYHFNSIPGFVLREFWTSEFNFGASDEDFNICREAFIKVGSVNNIDLLPQKRQKLVQIFLSKCQQKYTKDTRLVFEDNLRVLNSLVCDWEFDAKLLSSRDLRSSWVSRSRECQITSNKLSQSIWKQIHNDSLNEILFALGPNNLCQVVPLDYWENAIIGEFEFDRLFWTLDKIAEHELSTKTRECLEAAVKRARDAMRNSLKLNENLFFRNQNDVKCKPLLVLKTLNKFLESDWLVNKEWEPSECANLIGSNPSWFTRDQIKTYVYNLEMRNDAVNILFMEKSHWKFANLIPYLSYKSVENLFEKLQRSQAPSRENYLSQLKFFGSLKWPVNSHHSSNAEFILQHFKTKLLLLPEKDRQYVLSRDKIDLYGNLICSLTGGVNNTDLVHIQRGYYCTENGTIHKSPIPLMYVHSAPSWPIPTPSLLMDPLNQHIAILTANIDEDWTILPMDFFKAKYRMCQHIEVDENFSLEQIRFLVENCEHSLSGPQLKSLLTKINGGEYLEIEPEEEVVDSEIGTNGNQQPNNDKDTTNETDYEFNLVQSSYHNYIVYITLSATHLKQNFLTIILVLTANLLKHF